jgi:hypothetical protein
MCGYVYLAAMHKYTADHRVWIINCWFRMRVADSAQKLADDSVKCLLGSGFALLLPWRVGRLANTVHILRSTGSEDKSSVV